jgi:hypothetical protein
MTHDLIKLEYFDAVVQKLKELAVCIDEDCPHKYRTDALSNTMRDTFDLLDEVAHQHLMRTDGDNIPPISL